jgi:peptidoglycan/xylan/chitin deacetylase (PgdA/CDA1 family)
MASARTRRSWPRLTTGIVIVTAFAVLVPAMVGAPGPRVPRLEPVGSVRPALARLDRQLTALSREALRFIRPPRFIRRIETNDPVVFVTIDDGWTRSADALRLIRRSGMPVTAFLLVTAAQRGRVAYFRDLARAGARIENHTRTHPFLPALTPRRARHELCGASRQLEAWFGRRPVLFRPPYGGWRPGLMRAIDACGMHTVVMWTAEIEHGRLTVRENRALRRGDIVLLHFRRDLRRDLEVLRRELRRRGWRVAPLERYL